MTDASVKTYRIVASNDFTGEVYDEHDFAGSEQELDEHITTIWNATFAHMADRGNTIKAYVGDHCCYDIADYSEEESDAE